MLRPSAIESKSGPSANNCRSPGIWNFSSSNWKNSSGKFHFCSNCSKLDRLKPSFALIKSRWKNCENWTESKSTTESNNFPSQEKFIHRLSLPKVPISFVRNLYQNSVASVITKSCNPTSIRKYGEASSMFRFRFRFRFRGGPVSRAR